MKAYDALMFLESNLTPRKGAEISWSIQDGFTLALTKHDGATTYAMVSGRTLLEAIEKLAKEAQRREQGA